MSLPSPGASSRDGRRRRRAMGRLWPALALLAALLVLWQLAATALHPGPEVLPGPRLVLSASWQDRSNLLSAMWATTVEAVAGILVATVAAVAFALAIDWSRSVRRTVYPVLLASQTLPLIVLAPLVVIWFGFGEAPKVALVALFTFFPIVVGAVQGLESADPDALALLRTMGATRGQLVWRVRVPGGLGQFFTGLKVAVTYAYVSAIFAEYVGGERGLGVYMQAAKNSLVHTELVFGAVLATALLTGLLFLVVGLIERVAMPWRHPAPSEAVW